MTEHELADRIVKMQKSQRYEGFGVASLIPDIESLLAEEFAKIRKEASAWGYEEGLKAKLGKEPEKFQDAPCQWIEDEK